MGILSHSFPLKEYEGDMGVRERHPPRCLLPLIESDGRREGGKRTASPSLSFPSPKRKARMDGCTRAGLPFSPPRFLKRTRKETWSEEEGTPLMFLSFTWKERKERIRWPSISVL